MRDVGRAEPGGGGIGRPLGESGRPGGGGMALPLGDTGRAAGVGAGAAVGSGRERISVTMDVGGASGGRPPAVGRALEMTRDDESSTCSATAGAGVATGAGAGSAGATTSFAAGRRRGRDVGGPCDGRCGGGRCGAAGDSAGAGAALGHHRYGGSDRQVGSDRRGGCIRRRPRDGLRCCCCGRRRVRRCHRFGRGRGGCRGDVGRRRGSDRLGGRDRRGGWSGGGCLGHGGFARLRLGGGGDLCRRGLGGRGLGRRGLGRRGLGGRRVHVGRRGLLGGGLLGRLLLRLDLLGLLGTSQSVALGAPRHHVGIRLGERRRRALRGNAQRRAEAEDLCVRHPELLRELMDPDLLSCHVSDSTFHCRHSLFDARITGCTGCASGGRLNGVRHQVLLVSPVRRPAATSCARPARTHCGAMPRRGTAARPRLLRPRSGTATRRARRSHRRSPGDQPRR